MESNGVCWLPDGRYLGYALYGDPNGYPVLYFHGGQESRLSCAFMHEACCAIGIRLISPERPGIGLSTFQPQRKFSDWASDIQELVRHLQLPQYSIFGLSGGAPHVLACLNTEVKGLSKAAVVSGATPYNYKGSLKGMWFPVQMMHFMASFKNKSFLSKAIDYDYRELRDSPEKRLKQLQKHLPRPDRVLLNTNPDYGMEFIRGSLEAYTQGIDGVVQEWQMYVRDWEIDFDRIEHPLTLWYGTSDKMAPPARAEFYDRRIPHARLNLIENEGHFSLIRNHIRPILNDLLP